MPLFDEYFRGYGMNKLTWNAHIATMGFNFTVLAGAFMLHLPHPETCAATEWQDFFGANRPRKGGAHLQPRPSRKLTKP